jgi:hyperosmotically inducible protein
MKIVKNLFNSALLIAFISLVGCASTSKHEGTGEYVDDTVITSKVKYAVMSEDTLKSAEINVETYKGVVQLSGFVSTDKEIAKAVEVTKAVKGVKSVRNDIHIKPTK